MTAVSGSGTWTRCWCWHPRAGVEIVVSAALPRDGDGWYRRHELVARQNSRSGQPGLAAGVPVNIAGVESDCRAVYRGRVKSADAHGTQREDYIHTDVELDE